MKINNTNVRGIYAYNSSVQFESGDYIIDEGKIYIAQTSVLGVKPSLGVVNGLYKVYLSDDIASLDEIQNGTAGTKLVSVQTLVSLLESRVSGISSRGIITNEILGDTKAAELYLTNFFGNMVEKGMYADILDQLIISKTVGCAVYKVSAEATTIGAGTKDDYVILHQYAYLSSGGVVDKVQEIIASDLIAVRSGSTSGNISEWKILKSDEPLKLVNGIVSVYESKINELNNIRYSLADNYGKLVVSGERFNSSEYAEVRNKNVGKSISVAFRDIAYTYKVTTPTAVTVKTVVVPDVNIITVLNWFEEVDLGTFSQGGTSYKYKVVTDADLVTKLVLSEENGHVIQEFNPGIVSLELTISEQLDQERDRVFTDLSETGGSYKVRYVPGVDYFVKLQVDLGDDGYKEDVIIFTDEELQEIYGNPRVIDSSGEIDPSFVKSIVYTNRNDEVDRIDHYYGIEAWALTIEGTRDSDGYLYFAAYPVLFGDNVVSDPPCSNPETLKTVTEEGISIISIGRFG